MSGDVIYELAEPGERVEAFDFTLLVQFDWRSFTPYGARIVANRFLRWDKSTSTDVVGYKIFAKKDVDPTDSDPSFAVGNVDNVDLTTIPFLANADGIYHLSVKSVDEAGLEGQHARVTGPLDFVPPAPATNVRLSEA